MVKKPIIIANWKMYVEKPEAVKRFSLALKRRSKLLSRVEVMVAPPFTLLSMLSSAFPKSKTVRVGAQTISGHADKQHTGEVSGVMLKALGASMAIIGHSERRAEGETDDVVRMQMKAASASGLLAVLCVGEKERDPAGGHFGFIEQQLSNALKDKMGGKLIVAYEPVWAIGKQAGDAMKPQDLEEMVIFIRKTLADLMGRPAALKVPILYGGSVEGSNAAELLKEGTVSGFLVGHASAEADTFLEIIEAASK